MQCDCEHAKCPRHDCVPGSCKNTPILKVTMYGMTEYLCEGCFGTTIATLVPGVPIKIEILPV